MTTIEIGPNLGATISVSVVFLSLALAVWGMYRRKP